MHSHKLWWKVLLTGFLAVLLVTACNDPGEKWDLQLHDPLVDSNGGGSANSDASPSAPRMSQISVTQTGATTAKVTWDPATDDTTPHEQMGYEVHVSESGDFTPDGTTRRATIFGITEADIDGLGLGKTYYVLVVAEDQQGTQSEQRDYQRISLAIPPEPQFPGIAFSAPSDMSQATLAWLPANDDKTSPSAIAYEIHLSQQPDFEPTSRTLKSTVIGETKQVISGLSPGTTYHVMVTAIDEDGNRSTVGEPHTLTTLSGPVIVNPAASFATDEDIGLGGVVQNGSQYTFLQYNPATLPASGSILFIHVGDELHLRRVQSSTLNNNELVVQTSDAALSDILDEATISTQVTLYESDDNQAHFSSQLAASPYEQEQLRTLRSSNNMFVAQEGSSLSDLCKAETKGAITAFARLSFEPTFDFSLSWKKAGFIPKLAGGHAIARGTLTASVGFSIKGEDGVSCSAEKTFLTRRSVQSYLVAGVPVVQVTTFTLKGKASINVNAELTSEASANAIGKAAIGVEFNPNSNAWEKRSESPSLEFNLDNADAFPKLEGSVSGELRLIPEVSVRFYAIAGPKVSIEPSVSATMGVESAPPLVRIGFPPVQMSKFDIASALDINIGLSLGAFGKFAELDDATLFSEHWTLLSLPKLSVSGGSGKVDETIHVTGHAADGANNIFSSDSVLWYVDPNDASISGGENATFTSSEQGTYTVFFAGYGKSTPAIPQFAWADVNVGNTEEPSENPCPNGWDVVSETIGKPSACFCSGASVTATSNTVATNAGGWGDEKIIELSSPSNLYISEGGNKAGFSGFIDSSTKFLTKTTTCIDPECGTRHGVTTYKYVEAYVCQ